MKIEIDVPVEEFDYESQYDYYTGEKNNHFKVLLDVITDKAASLIVEQIDYDKRLNLETTLENKITSIEQHLENAVVEKVSKDGYKIITNKITETIVNSLTDKYERSQQYREIKKQFKIENDRDINNGMRTLISDIVKSEVKKIIKL